MIKIKFEIESPKQYFRIVKVKFDNFKKPFSDELLAFSNINITIGFNYIFHKESYSDTLLFLCPKLKFSKDASLEASFFVYNYSFGRKYSH